MAVNFFAEDVQMPEMAQDYIENGLSYLIENEEFQAGDISVVFCSDAYLLEMNKKYLNHDYFTDIITFDYVEDGVISGDLFISLDRIHENAEKFADNISQEMYRVIIHGVLHLCGYKDKTDEEKTEMRAKEDFYLKKLLKL